MKKKYFYLLIIVLTALLSGFVSHKFYVAIYQIKYTKEKKTIQITARIFIDDLQAVLQKKYHYKCNLGEKTETPEDLEFFKKYWADNFGIIVNKNAQKVNLVSKSIDDNVLVCNFSITGVGKIKSIVLQNSILFDFTEQQQNMIQTNVNGIKQDALCTPDNPKILLNF